MLNREKTVVLVILLAASAGACRGKKEQASAARPQEKSAPVKYVDSLLADVEKTRSAQEKANDANRRREDDLREVTAFSEEKN